MIYKRILLLVAMLAVGFVLIVLYTYFNPAEHGFFPQCPVKHVTGLDCPGCGSQRALHDLFNGHIKQAFAQNQLVFALVPYALLGFYLQLVPEATASERRWRSTLYGRRAMQVVLAVIIVFTVVRNFI